MMIRRFLNPHAATALVDDAVIQRHRTCPLCYTTNASLSNNALAAGGGWRCARCGQRWDARRLAVIAAFAAWRVEPGTAAGGGQGTQPSDVARVARVLPFAANRASAV